MKGSCLTACRLYQYWLLCAVIEVGFAYLFTMLYLLLLLFSRLVAVIANTEKAIFLGPRELQVPIEHPALEDLLLETLSPQRWSARTHIKAEFPTNITKHGQSTWLLLHGLREGQRYEVRICWAATQPTSFRLDTYELPIVFETPELIASLAKYSDSRQPKPIEIEDQKSSISTADVTSKPIFEYASSILFLHVLAAADYFTMNQTLMEKVPPVFVDIILDPYIFNVFPRTLISTASYIMILAIGSWFLSKFISKKVLVIAKDRVKLEKKTR